MRTPYQISIPLYGKYSQNGAINSIMGWFSKKKTSDTNSVEETSETSTTKFEWKLLQIMDQHAKVSKNQLKRDNFTLKSSSSSSTFCHETITLYI